VWHAFASESVLAPDKGCPHERVSPPIIKLNGGEKPNKGFSCERELASARATAPRHHRRARAEELVRLRGRPNPEKGMKPRPRLAGALVSAIRAVAHPEYRLADHDGVYCEVVHEPLDDSDYHVSIWVVPVDSREAAQTVCHWIPPCDWRTAFGAKQMKDLRNSLRERVAAAFTVCATDFSYVLDDSPSS